MRRPPVTLWVLRVVLTAHASLAVTQPILIGAYLDGAFDALAGHRGDGLVLPVLALAATAAAVAYAVIDRGPWHPVPATLTLALLEGVQLGTGFARVLAVHIPLGVLIVGGAVVLAVWSWTSRARRPRDERRSSVEDAAAEADVPAAKVGR